MSDDENELGPICTACHEPCGGYEENLGPHEDPYWVASSDCCHADLLGSDEEIREAIDRTRRQQADRYQQTWDDEPEVAF